MRAELPDNEKERLDALRGYRVLDTPPEACFDDITQLASHLCGTPIAAVSLVDGERQWFKARVGLDVSETPRDVAFCAHAILEPELLVVSDARRDRRFAANPLVTGAPGIRFYAGAPLITQGGESLGSLCVIDRAPRTLSSVQADALRALSRQVMAQLELRRHVAEQERQRRSLLDLHRQLEETNARLEAESLTDDVTGFHNTRFLHRHLAEALADGAPAAAPLSLLFFDLDRFKEVVDAHGHLCGARVLREVAQAVSGQLGRRDRIVRYGGDEYVVLLPGAGREAAAAKAEALRRTIAATAFLADAGGPVQVTASFGVATFPDDAGGPRELLGLADRGLFRSKAAGRNRVSRAPR